MQQPEHVEPVISVAVEPATRRDREGFGPAILQIAAQDLHVTWATDDTSAQVIIKGLSEDHLEAVIVRLKDEFGIALNVSAPQVAYRETITLEVEQDYSHEEQTGRSGRYARVKLRLTPLRRGIGFQFANEAQDGAVPRGYVPGVIRGIEAGRQNGPLAGFRVIDLKVTLVDGAYHDVDSSELTFEIAAREALRKATRKASPELLEPFMNVEVFSPRSCTATVEEDLRLRRGRITAREGIGDDKVFSGLVPLANMFGYSNTLRSITLGAGKFTLAFSHYEAVPSDSWHDPKSPAQIKRRA